MDKARHQLPTSSTQRGSRPADDAIRSAGRAAPGRARSLGLARGVGDPAAVGTVQPAVAQSAELQGLVQQSGPGERSASVRELAHQGIRGGSSRLPHYEHIQRSFGTHDLSDVRAHLGSEASKASEQMGARAYATGQDIAFKGAPDVHTAAHEAAHVVQQRAGVQLAGGVGRAGDGYERHADAVADAVVRGESAEGLLSAFSGGGEAGAVQAMVQMEPNEGPLTERQVRSAIGYNSRRGMPAEAWSKVAGVVGSTETELGAGLVQKLATWQKAKGLTGDGMAGNITTQWLSQEGGGDGLEAYVKSNDTVYLGINPKSRKIELARLKSVAGSKNVTGVTGEKNQDTAVVKGNRVDLDTEEGRAAFAQSLEALDAARQDQVMEALRRAAEDSRDEIAQYIRVLYETEMGQRLIKRVVLSGHSGGWSIGGEPGNDTYLTFSQLAGLRPIFPIAHGQVEDIMLSACNTGQRRKLSQFTEIFPKLRSIWAYVGYSPSAATGSLRHIAEWEKASRGTIDASRMDAGRSTVAGGSGKRDKNAAVRTKDAGGKEAYETASPEAALDYDTIRGVVDSNMEHFKAAFEAGNINQAELNSLYTYLQNLVGNYGGRLGSELPAFERITKQTLYLRHWRKVSEKFMERFGSDIRAGYGDARVPNYKGAARSQTLGYIKDYPTPGDRAHALLTQYLRDLDPAVIPDTWY